MIMSRSDLILTERKDNIAYLVLNRPSVLNAINPELLVRLKDELERIKKDPEIRAVILTGAGDRAFSAGADIEYLNRATPIEIRDLAKLAIAVTNLIENLNKVSLALINGYALGGGLEIAEACMLRVASENAKLGHPEVVIGAISGWGGTTRLPRLVGKGRAAELLLTGRMITATEAFEIGLVNRVTRPEELKRAGEDLLREILQHPQTAISLTWEAIHRGLDLSVDESARLGADLFGIVASTDEFRKGTEAFLKKRK
jgi:enoyl-CoA hydratase